MDVSIVEFITGFTVDKLEEKYASNKIHHKFDTFSLDDMISPENYVKENKPMWLYLMAKNDQISVAQGLGMHRKWI